jgi:hypothetical protein
VLAALVAVLAVVAVVLVAGGGDEPSKKDREVLLESTAAASTAPFTPDLVPVSAITPTTLAPATTVPSTVAGGTGRVAQGPFGGTGDNTLCDRELLVSYLTDPANAQVAKEWARVLSVNVSDIPDYIRALIPTTLTQDARVTNHNFVNGRAVGYQAVLQAGTAVLVDTKGRLIARCRCGNPLLPPQEVSKPIYTGPKWEGFDPRVIVVVVPSPQPIYPPGGVGTLPTTPTTRKGSTPTTTFGSESDAAEARLKTSFEACIRARAFGITGGLSDADLEQVLASAQYSSTLVDQKTGTYRVTITIPDQTLSTGDLTGDSASWDVSILTGDITPADDNARAASRGCPELA